MPANSVETKISYRRRRQGRGFRGPHSEATRRRLSIAQKAVIARSPPNVMKNPVEVVDDVAFILLTKGTRTFVAKIDADMLTAVARHSWQVNIQKNGEPRASCSYWEDGKKRHKYMHHLVVPKGELEIDHKNGDSLDNRRSNLRVCTRSENLRNTRAFRDGRVMGVFWHDVNQGWYVRRRINGKYVYNGFNYKKYRDAVKASRELYSVE